MLHRGPKAYQTHGCTTQSSKLWVRDRLRLIWNQLVADQIDLESLTSRIVQAFPRSPVSRQEQVIPASEAGRRKDERPHRVDHRLRWESHAVGLRLAKKAGPQLRKQW
jgi:hypothetical protein